MKVPAQRVALVGDNSAPMTSNFTLKKKMVRIGTCLSNSTRCSEKEPFTTANVTTTNATTINAFTSSTQQSAVCSASGSPSKLVLLKDIVNSPLVLSLNNTNLNRSTINRKEEDQPKPSDVMKKRLGRIIQRLPACDKM